MCILFGTHDAIPMSVPCPPCYLARPCVVVRASPSASTSATIRCVTHPPVPRHHPLRSNISYRLGISSSHPLPSFIPPLCQPFPYGIPIIPSFHPPFSFLPPLFSVSPPVSSLHPLSSFGPHLPSLRPLILSFSPSSPTAHPFAHCV